MKIKPEKAKIKITAGKTEEIDVILRNMIEEDGYSIQGTKFSKSMDNSQVTFSMDVSCPDGKAWDRLSKKLYNHKDIYKADIEY